MKCFMCRTYKSTTNATKEKSNNQKLFVQLRIDHINITVSIKMNASVLETLLIFPSLNKTFYKKGSI